MGKMRVKYFLKQSRGRQNLGDVLIRLEGSLGAAYGKRKATLVGAPEWYPQTGRPGLRRKHRVERQLLWVTEERDEILAPNH